MNEYKLTPGESLTIMDIVQDTIDRGMIALDYELNQIEEIINKTTTEFGDYKDDVEFEVIIKVKSKCDK